MTRREDIIVALGGDSKQLMRDLNMSKQGFQTFARDVAKEINEGHIPQAWRSYSKNASAALKHVETEGKRGITSFGEVAKSTLTKVGAAFAAAFGVRAIIAGLREVSKEIGEVDKSLNASHYLKQQRDAQLSGMSASDKENIVAGNVQMSRAWSGVKDLLAKAAGGAAILIDATKEKFTGGILERGMSWEKAITKAVENEKALIQGIKAAAAEAEAQKAAEKAKADNRKAALEDLKKWREENRFQRAVEKYHMEQQLAARQRITAEILRQNALLAQQQQLGVLGYKGAEFADTLGEMGGALPEGDPSSPAPSGNPQFPGLGAGKDEYLKNTSDRMAAWMEHATSFTPEKMRYRNLTFERFNMRNPPLPDKQPSGNTAAEILSKLQEGVKVKVELDE